MSRDIGEPLHKRKRRCKTREVNGQRIINTRRIAGPYDVRSLVSKASGNCQARWIHRRRVVTEQHNSCKHVASSSTCHHAFASCRFCYHVCRLALMSGLNEDKSSGEWLSVTSGRRHSLSKSQRPVSRDSSALSVCPYWPNPRLKSRTHLPWPVPVKRQQYPTKPASSKSTDYRIQHRLFKVCLGTT